MTDKAMKAMEFERRVVMEFVAAAGPVGILDIQHEIARQTGARDTVTASLRHLTALIRAGLVEITEGDDMAAFCVWGEGPYGETEEGARMEGGK